MNETVGLLVHGHNHFIVGGPLPSRAIALQLVRLWSVIEIGSSTPPQLAQWTIRSREFRENLSWAVVVPDDSGESPAVAALLGELANRGVAIHNSELEAW